MASWFYFRIDGVLRTRRYRLVLSLYTIVGLATDHYFKEIPPMDPFEVDRITDAPIVQDVSGKLAYVRFLPRP